MIDFIKYYKEIVGLEISSESDKEMQACCPFHDDKVASLSINKKTGLWKCFGTCSEGGNVFQFHAKSYAKDGMTVPRARKDIEIRLGIYKTLPLELIEKHHHQLLKNQSLLDFLINERGISQNTIDRFQLGCDEQRIFIPVLDEDGLLVNIRKYKPHAAEVKVISYKEGYGEGRVFPRENLKYNEILLVEGEMDCLLANELGYNAVTITTGAGGFKKDFAELFEDKVVHICYDIDKPGKDGAKKAAKILSKYSRVKIIDLPITTPEHGDLTDYFILHKHTKQEFNALVKALPYYAKIKEAEIVDEKVYDVSLNTAANKEYYYKHVKMKVVVSGKDLAPYFAPCLLRLTCDQGMKTCKWCKLGLAGGELDIEFSTYNNEILQLINCSEVQQKTLIRQKAGISKCTQFEIEVKKVINIEEMRVIPEIDYAAQDTDYVTRQIYYLGYGIKTNRSYLLQGITVPDPQTQYATQIIQSANPTQSSIDQFKMTPELYDQLKIFQAKDLKAKLREIHKDLTYNVTKIYGREDLITAVDLIYHSILQFKFQGNIVQKGWVDGLIIGDTRCGKTESLIQLIQHYRLGELCTGENISYAGLVGGMSQTQQRWSINWGKIPLNDRRLIVLDEVSSLEVDTISNLSALRSSGIAEIIKIQTERTNARTRLVWVSNPRSGRKLDTYNYGVLAIKELIGKVEDIARFDFAVSIAANEVPIEEINRPHTEKVKQVFTSDLCNKLIIWTWSRTVDQIKFTPAAEKAILQYAMILGKKYSSSVPLIEGAEQRIKLAKMAISIAGRLFSTTDGEIILVTEDHVKFIYEFLEKIYSKPSMGYDLFSLAHKRATTLTQDTKNTLVQDFQGFGSWKLLRELLLEYQTFRKTELADQMGYDIEENRKLFRWLTAKRLIKSVTQGYAKQPSFTAFLKTLDVTGEEPPEHKFKI